MAGGGGDPGSGPAPRIDPDRCPLTLVTSTCPSRVNAIPHGPPQVGGNRNGAQRPLATSTCTMIDARAVDAAVHVIAARGGIPPRV